MTHTDLSGGLDSASEYFLDQCPTVPETRDAANLWLEASDASFGMRIGIEAVAEEWDAHDIWLDIAFANGRVISARQPGATHDCFDQSGRAAIRGAGPLQIQCIAPFKHWRTVFNGAVPTTTASALLEGSWPETPSTEEVAFDIDMQMAVPPWVPGSLLPDAKAVLNGDQGSFVSPRYEQLFRATGSLSIGDDHFEVDANGLRIRRQGVRKFQGFWGHCWQSAIFPSGRAFGFNSFPPQGDGKPSYNEGYVFDGEGRLKPARAVHIPWLRTLRTRGDDVSCVLETADGLLEIQGETFINTRSRPGSALPADFPADFPVVQQAHARYRWGDEETCGMVERSTPGDQLQ